MIMYPNTYSISMYGISMYGEYRLGVSGAGGSANMATYNASESVGNQKRNRQLCSVLVMYTRRHSHWLVRQPKQTVLANKVANTVSKMVARPLRSQPSLALALALALVP